MSFFTKLQFSESFPRNYSNCFISAMFHSTFERYTLPSQEFNVGSILFECFESTFKYRWSNAENDTNSSVGFLTLRKVDTNVQTLKQCWNKSIQRYLNVLSTWP